VESRGQTEPDTARLARVRLLALDVDGVLTDGKIVYGEAGPADERLAFDVQDGIALRWLQEAGIAVAWISGRGSPALMHRARELGILEVHLRAVSKRETLREMQVRLGIAPEETAAMGDDLPDLGLRSRSGFFAAPANARPEVRERADVVTGASGGRGAVRELCERLLRAQGRWQAIVDAAER
jgi:3-deoxy-D-manno-octulosonate 8-phosphate phosphatase (KDO 8-P phosphatase)